MAMAVGGSTGPKSDINITPLVDVVLVLLIIFMVVTPLAQRGYDLEIPKESQQNTPPPDQNDVKNVMLSISAEACNIAMPLSGAKTLPADCKVRINDEETPLNEMGNKLSEIMKARKKSEKVLFLAAQNKLNYEAVVQILDMAKNAVGEDLKVAVVSDEKFASGGGAAGAPSTIQ